MFSVVSEVSCVYVTQVNQWFTWVQPPWEYAVSFKKCQNMLYWGYCDHFTIWLMAYALMLLKHGWNNKWTNNQAFALIFSMVYKPDRQTDMCWCCEWYGVSPGQRRLPPVPEPGHHNCWAEQVAARQSAPLSACGLPPAPPAASWTHTQQRRLPH